MSDEANRPRWCEDFPVRWDEDQYMTRRELAKFLTLGSALLVAANGLIATVGLTRTPPHLPARRIAGIDDLPPSGSLLFRYPTADDPCILVRNASGHVDAFSQVCTHLSCAVVHRPAVGTLDCPCHKGSFSCLDGRPLAGPPTRRLPRIVIEQQGEDLVASLESRSDRMETRQQGSTLFAAILVLIATLVVIQLWLVAAALDALLAHQIAVLAPSALASLVLFVLSAGLLWYVTSFDERLRQWGPHD